MNIKEAEQLCVLETLVGSRLYGTNTEKSDYDYRGVFVAPIDTKVGLIGAVEQVEDPNGDRTLFEIKKFFKLSADANPNILDILFAPEDEYITKTKVGQAILNNKRMFLSSKIRFTFSGYAYSQLTRLKNHMRWVERYPDAGVVLEILKYAFENKRIDFNWLKDHFGGNVAREVCGDNIDFKITISPTVDYILIKIKNASKYAYPKVNNFVEVIKNNTNESKPEYYLTGLPVKHGNTVFVFKDISRRLYSRDGNFNYSKQEEEQTLPSLNKANYILSINTDAYEAAKKEVDKMWEWKINRNKERSVEEDKIGFDTKHASHLVRLMIGGLDILKTGEYKPKLEGNRLALIKGIRDGVLTYNEIIKIAEDAEKQMEKWYDKTTLPKKPDINAINKLLISLSL